jgi:hypothetical protein
MRVLAAIAALWLASALPVAAKAPVVVEVFTSQGCATCADSSAYVADLAARPDVLALTFSVDYWDYLGWRDTFARPEFANRQKAYVKRLTAKAAYTPQLVIGGRAQAAASKTELVDRLIRETRRLPADPPRMQRLGPDRVAVGSGLSPKAGADVWLVRYNPRGEEVEVRRGENRGKTISYRNVVHELVRLGAWNGRPRAYRLTASHDDSLKTAILVQEADGGRVLALLAD